jgi:hypothetical protein
MARPCFDTLTMVMIKPGLSRQITISMTELTKTTPLP